MHRDIKPENIMFDSAGGTPKFIDFGLAIQMDSSILELAGTPYYLAPEVIDENYGAECDIWSLGVVLYQLMSGDVPFDGNSYEELFSNIKHSAPQMPSHFSKDMRDII